MGVQDRVNVLFSLFVNALNAARVVRVMSTMVVTLMLVALLVKAPDWITYAPMSGSAQRLEAFVVREKPVFDWGSMGESKVASALAANQRRLSDEQRNIVSYISKKYSADKSEIESYVTMAYQAAKEFRVDPMLVLAVMSIESAFDPDAESHVGAQGLMQVLTRVHKEKFLRFGGTQHAFDPLVNIRVGTQILKSYVLMARGSLEGALKFYVGAAFHPNDGGYGYKVLSERARIQASAAGKPIPTQPLVKPGYLTTAGARDPSDELTREQTSQVDEGRLARILGDAGVRKVGKHADELDHGSETKSEVRPDAKVD